MLCNTLLQHRRAQSALVRGSGVALCCLRFPLYTREQENNSNACQENANTG